MAVFAISFRIESDSTYNERRNSLVEVAEKEAKGFTWDETTSLLILESDKSAEDLRNALYFGSKVTASKDMLVVIDLSMKDYAVVGDLKLPAVLDFLMKKR